MAQNINKDTVYRALKSKDKDYTKNDGGGLYLLVKVNGSKLWQFVYTIEGKRKNLALGIYPNVTLEAARRKAEEARDNIANGIDPSAIKNKPNKLHRLTLRTRHVKRQACQFSTVLNMWRAPGWIQSSI